MPASPLNVALSPSARASLPPSLSLSLSLSLCFASMAREKYCYASFCCCCCCCLRVAFDIHARACFVVLPAVVVVVAVLFVCLFDVCFVLPERFYLRLSVRAFGRRRAFPPSHATPRHSEGDAFDKWLLLQDSLCPASTPSFSLSLSLGLGSLALPGLEACGVARCSAIAVCFPLLFYM